MVWILELCRFSSIRWVKKKWVCIENNIKHSISTKTLSSILSSQNLVLVCHAACDQGTYLVSKTKSCFQRLKELLSKLIQHRGHYLLVHLKISEMFNDVVSWVLSGVKQLHLCIIGTLDLIYNEENCFSQEPSTWLLQLLDFLNDSIEMVHSIEMVCIIKKFNFVWVCKMFMMYKIILD